MSDIFDQIAPDQKPAQGDIFDQIAPDATAAPAPALSKGAATSQIDKLTTTPGSPAPKQPSRGLQPLIPTTPAPLSQGEQAFQQSVTQSGKAIQQTPFRIPTRPEVQQSMRNLTMAPQRADATVRNMKPALTARDHASQGLSTIGDQITAMDADIEAQRAGVDTTNQASLDAFNAKVNQRNQLAQTFQTQHAKVGAMQQALNQTVDATNAQADRYTPSPLDRDGLRPAPGVETARIAGPARPNVDVQPDTRHLDEVIMGEENQPGRSNRDLTFEDLSRQADAQMKYMGENPGEAVGNAVFPGVGTTLSGAGQAITGDGGTRGAGVAKAFAGVGDIVQPFIGIDAVENPMGLVKGMGAGAITSEAAGHMAHAAGASPQTEANIRSAAFWIPSFIGGKLVSLRDPKTGEVVGVGGTAFNDKVQAAVTREPGAYRGAVKVGGTRVGVEIPRTRQPSPLNRRQC